MKKWLIYYIITFTSWFSVAFIFKEYTDVHSFWPLVPAFFMLLSFVLTVYYYRDDIKENIDIESSPKPDLNYQEQYDLSMCQHMSYGISIPFYLPILFFVPNFFKFSSIVVFVITIFGGPLFFRIKYGKIVKMRIYKERTELKTQKEKEELGKWK